MGNPKPAGHILLLAISVVGFLWGLLLQIQLSRTTHALTTMKIGKLMMVISIIIFVAGIILARRNTRKFSK